MKSIQLPPILCVGFPTWEGDYQKSTIQLVKALANEQRILYVEYPFTWKDVWQGIRRRNRPWRRILGITSRLRMISSGEKGELYVLTLPPLLPINGLASGWLYERLAIFNARIAERYIRQALHALRYESPLLINANNPFLGAYLKDRLPVRQRIYYCYDEISAARWTHRHGPRLEQRLLAQVDGVVASSRPLLKVKSRRQKPNLLLSNGVNTALFEQAFSQTPAQSQTPTLGYLGTVDERLDVDLLLNLLDQWTEAKLLLVGRVIHADVRARLSQHPRVEMVGAQAPEALPQWMRRMQIGLIPFRSDEFTRHISPLKINEYLAAGLPVVSTNFGDLSDFTDVAAIADCQDAFIGACRDLWQNDNEGQRTQRRLFARTHSWEGKADQLTKWLATHLDLA